MTYGATSYGTEPYGSELPEGAPTVPTYVLDTDWGLAEDEALKAKLSGFSVTNPANGSQIPVPVFFRMPDTEEVTRTFPHIAIDLVEIVFDPTRAHRAVQFPLPYTPVGITPPEGTALVADDYPLPWSLHYQIATYARQPRHDRQLQMLMFRMFPEQYGSLNMGEIDGTIRRADLLNAFRRDTVDASKKRLYRYIYTVAVSSEFFANEVQAIQLATGIQITYEPVVGGLVSA